MNKFNFITAAGDSDGKHYLTRCEAVLDDASDHQIPASDIPDADGKYGGWSSWHVMDAFRAARMRTRQADADYLAKLELAAHVADRAVSREIQVGRDYDASAPQIPSELSVYFDGHRCLPKRIKDPKGEFDSAYVCVDCGYTPVLDLFCECPAAPKPADPIEQFNARRIAAKARYSDDVIDWDESAHEAVTAYTLATAMSVPLPHDTDRHDRLTSHRHRSE